MSEATPGGLLGQEPGQEIEGMNGAQDGEQMDAEELSLGVAETTTWTVRMGPPGVDEVVRNEGGKEVEKFSSTGLGKGLRHGEKPTPLDTA